MIKPNTNILILGQTGVGKSSLLNYLWGKELATVGHTKPTTQKGIHKIKPFEFGDLMLTIYDSWGLEADKADKWKTDILAAISSNDKTMKDWYHTLVYCFDSCKARIEDFEINEIIKPLIEEGNRFCFVLTKSDVSTEEQKEKLKKILKDEFPNFRILETCSVSQTLRNGTITQVFGKDAFFKMFCENLWDNLTYKVPIAYRNYAQEKLSKWRISVLDSFDNETGLFTLKSTAVNNTVDIAQRLAEDMHKENMIFLQNTLEEARTQMGAAVASVNRIYVHKIHNGIMDDKNILSLAKWDTDKFIINGIMYAIPVLNIFWTIIGEKIIKDELDEKLVEYSTDYEEKVINKICERIEQERKKTFQLL